MGIHTFERSCHLNGDLSENGHKTQQDFDIKAKSEMKGIKKNCHPNSECSLTSALP